MSGEERKNKPDPPEDRPIEDLPPVMSTGAFGIPMSDLEPEQEQPPPPPEMPASLGDEPEQPPAPPVTPSAPQAAQPPGPEAPRQQPPDRPIEDLGPVMSTGAFGIPMSDLAEPGQRPAGQQPPPAAPPAGQQPPPAAPPAPQAPPPTPGFQSGSPLGAPPTGSPQGFAPPRPAGPQSFPPPPTGAPQGFGPPQPSQPQPFPPSPQSGLPGMGPPPVGSPPMGAPAAAMRQFVLAGWGSRVGAALLDGLILSVVAAIIAAPLGILGGSGASDEDQGLVAVLVGILLFIVIVNVLALLYYPIIMSRTNGQTLGKMATGIRVARTDGQPITAGFALVREVLVKGLLVGIVSNFTLGLAGLADYLWPLWDSENRALHDMVVSTRVVRA